MDLQKTGEFISCLRKKHGWTQSELAEQIGVTDKAVSRWETGRGFPDVSCLTALADVLEVSVSELIRGERIELEGKKTAEIMEEVDQTVVSTLEFSQKNTGRAWVAASALFLAGSVALLCVLGAVYRDFILFWSDIPARYAAYFLLIFLLIPVGVPALIYWMGPKYPRLTTFKTYLAAFAVSFFLVMMGAALFYPEFYIALADAELLQYDFNDTALHEVLFEVLPITWALTAALNTICAALRSVRFKK